MLVALLDSSISVQTLCTWLFFSCPLLRLICVKSRRLFKPSVRCTRSRKRFRRRWPANYFAMVEAWWAVARVLSRDVGLSRECASERIVRSRWEGVSGYVKSCTKGFRCCWQKIDNLLRISTPEYSQAVGKRGLYIAVYLSRVKSLGFRLCGLYCR